MTSTDDGIKIEVSEEQPAKVFGASLEIWESDSKQTIERFGQLEKQFVHKTEIDDGTQRNRTNFPVVSENLFNLNISTLKRDPSKQMKLRAK
jgi:hypothetical protein